MKKHCIILTAIFVFAYNGYSQTSIHFASGPDSIVSTRHSLSRLGVEKLSCDVNSSLVRNRIGMYKEKYGSRRPYIRVIDDNIGFQMTISPQTGIVYKLPEFTVEYDKIEILQPWYSYMDSASIDISETSDLVVRWINLCFGVSEREPQVYNTTSIELENCASDSTITVTLTEGLVEIDCLMEDHWIIKTQPWSESAESIEYQITKNSKTTFQFERIIHLPEKSILQRNSYQKMDGIYLLVEILIEEIQAKTNQTKILDEIIFSNYTIQFMK